MTNRKSPNIKSKELRLFCSSRPRRGSHPKRCANCEFSERELRPPLYRERQRASTSPKRFLVRSRGWRAAAVARSSALVELLHAGAVGENRTAAMHGGRRRARLLRNAGFSFFLSALHKHSACLFIQPPLPPRLHGGFSPAEGRWSVEEESLRSWFSARRKEKLSGIHRRCGRVSDSLKISCSSLRILPLCPVSPSSSDLLRNPKSLAGRFFSDSFASGGETHTGVKSGRLLQRRRSGGS